MAELSRMHPVPPRVATKVKFDDNVIVHHQTAWSDADYTAARRGPWMTAAVDRQRFQRRIRELSKTLDPILTEEHRLLARLRNMNLRV